MMGKDTGEMGMKKSKNAKVEKRMVQSVIVNGAGARRCNP